MLFRYDRTFTGRRKVLRGLLLAFIVLGLAGMRPGTQPAAHAAPIAGASLVATPSTAPADGVTAIALTAIVRDASGVGVPGVALRLSADQTSGTIVTQPLTVTTALGQATGAITSTVSGSFTVRLFDVSSGAQLAATGVTFVPAPDPATSTLSAAPATGAPSTSAGGTTSTVAVTITVRDYQGQPMPGRTIRLTSNGPSDRIVQPPATDARGMATGVVAFTGTATVVSAVDVASGVTLGSLTLRGVPPLTPTGIHALLSPAATRMGNGADRVAVRLTLLDGQNRPLVGRSVALTVSASFADPGPHAVTDAAGTATLSVGVRPGHQHYGAASGPVAVGAIDLGDNQPLSATTRITVYNRVAVMVAGVGTQLSCTLADCHDHIFAQVSADVLAPLGYNLNGDGLHRTELEYSYRGGAMKQMANGTWQWLIAPYKACDTVQPLDRSEAALRTLLQSYHTRYPYTAFELIGHSLGGLVALEGLAGDGGAFLRSLGPAAVDKVVVIDSPVNGVDQHMPLLMLGDLIGGLEYLRPCSNQLFGTYVLGHLATIGRQVPGLQDRWVATLRAARVEVLTVTNRADEVVPEQYAIIDYGRATHVSDRAVYAIGASQLDEHGALLARALHGRPNLVWPGFVQLLQGYLTSSCMPFAPSGTVCPYPTINVGF